MYKDITSIEELENIIKNEPAFIVYVSSPACSVCHSLRPKVIEAIKDNYPKISRYHVDLEISSEVTTKLDVLSAPTVLVFLDGKEFIRKHRTFSVDLLIDEIKRPYSLFVD